MKSDRNLTGLILAGGKSTRFGSDKASAVVAGRPMLQLVAEALAQVCESLVVVRAGGQQLPPIDVGAPVHVVDDRWPGRGPLAGLASGFPAVSTEYCFAASCDAPLLQPGLVRFLAERAAGHDIALVETGGHLNPLAAVYRASACLHAFESAVERGELKITDAFGGLDVVLVSEEEARIADPGLLSFWNANRPEALAEIETLLHEPGAGGQ